MENLKKKKMIKKNKKQMIYLKKECKKHGKKIVKKL